MKKKQSWQIKTKWHDITDILTPEGREEIPIGQYLRFEKIDLKVVRKRNGKVWAKEVFLYKPEEVGIINKNRKETNGAPVSKSDQSL